MVGSRVYVGGLPYGTRERDLEKFFKGYGRTRDILIKNGYGFVEFEDYRDADDAVYELNGKELLGERSVGLCHKLQSPYQSTHKDIHIKLFRFRLLYSQAGLWSNRLAARQEAPAVIETDTMTATTIDAEAVVATIGELSVWAPRR